MAFNISVTDSINVLEPAIAYDSSYFTYDSFLSYDGYYIPVQIVSNISVFDSITLTENTTIRLTSFISVFDSITITESVSCNEPINISVFDAITITENISCDKPLTISIFDNITITENLNESGQFNISVYDFIVVYEDIHNQGQLYLSVSDNITITENIIDSSFSFISVSDSITITENLFDAEGVNLFISENILITENIVTSISTGAVSVIDSVTLTDVPQLGLQSYISVFDSINTSEIVSLESFLFSPSRGTPIGQTKLKDGFIERKALVYNPIAVTRSPAGGISRGGRESSDIPVGLVN